MRNATHTIREKRARVIGELDDFEQLRQGAADIKDDVMSNLGRYLQQAEEALTRAGANVHWARDAAEANQIVVDIARRHKVDEVVKVKSMATQEIELNVALEAAGIAAWETDLAEMIVQLGDDLPSHILVPAIHRNRSEVREIFLREMGKVGMPPEAGLTDDPAELAGACPSPSSREVHAGQGRHLRGQLPRRGHRHPVRCGERGQRADVPHAARGPHHRGGDREGRAHLDRPRGVPAAAAALGNR
jgi:hypothetical protein